MTKEEKNIDKTIADEKGKADEQQLDGVKAADAPDDLSTRFEQIKQSVSEDDDVSDGSLTLKKILGGDVLSAQTVRHQVWLILLTVLFITVYVAFRYQCQQDIIDIVKKKQQLTDVKYRALSSSSTLTERCRESHILRALKNSPDSVIEVSKQPPYKIYVPEGEQ